jgi:hypothetical protein
VKWENRKIWRNTTRNSLNTNGLTDRKLPSIICGHHYLRNFLRLSFRRYIPADYFGRYLLTNDRWNIQIKKKGGLLTWQFLQVILPTESPRDSKWQLRTVTWSILRSNCWRTHRGIQTGISMQWRDLFTVRITDGIRLSAKVNIWPLYRPSPPLFLLLLPHPNSRLLQTTTPPKKKISLFSV